MSSAWGDSWDSAWGDSWGSIVDEQAAVIPQSSSSRRLRQRRLVSRYFDETPAPYRTVVTVSAREQNADSIFVGISVGAVTKVNIAAVESMTDAFDAKIGIEVSQVRIDARNRRNAAITMLLTS